MNADVGEVVVLEGGQEDPSRVVGGRSREPRLGKDPDSNDDRTDVPFFLGLFYIVGSFFIIDHFESNDVYRRKEDLETPLKKLNANDMININGPCGCPE